MKDELTRYGIGWQGPELPICKPMPDGLWTEWHIANARIEALTAEVEALKHDVSRQMDIATEHVNEVERLKEAVEPLSNLYGGDVNMNDPLRKWLTMADLERARAALQPQEKVG